MRQVIAGNWKMNGRIADVEPYAAALHAAPPHVDLVICPPFLLLERMVAALPGSAVAVGAQDCHAGSAGAHTGDIAAGSIKEAGARYVILGHSERRADHGETNAEVAAKASAAAMAGLVPIICVGETAAERDAGQAEPAVCSQIMHSLPPGFAGLVAYEPIWAIGTGRTPDAAEITAMHRAIRTALITQFAGGGAAMPILYGGSVKPANAGAILALPEVGGALVGGACLNAADLLAIAAGAPGL